MTAGTRSTSTKAGATPPTTSAAAVTRIFAAIFTKTIGRRSWLKPDPCHARHARLARNDDVVRGLHPGLFRGAGPNVGQSDASHKRSRAGHLFGQAESDVEIDRHAIA